MTVLAIDQGTSATKALVVADDGTVLGEGSCPVAPATTADGGVTQDPDELLSSITGAGRAALCAARLDAADVDAVGVGNQGETVLAWDRHSGEPTGPAIGWQDRRAATVTDALAGRAPRLRELTGLPLDPYFAAPKMTWLREQGAVGDGDVVTTVDAWLTHRLCDGDAFVTDAATASRTMLLDLDVLAWSPEACDAFGVDGAALPAVLANAAPVGETEAFGAPLPVCALIVDQQAALLAQSCLSPGEAKCTYGTGAFLLAHAGATRPRPASGASASVAWQLDGTRAYCVDGQLYTAGAAMRWLGGLGLDASPAALDALADRPAPGPDAPVFVPALAGLGAPQWSPRARGSWTGLSVAASAEDLIDAVVWGIAAAVARLAHAFADDLGAPLVALRVDGGLSRSRRLMQAQADLLGVPVQRYPSPDATALGVAALARLGAGIAADPASAVGAWEPSEVVAPRISRDEARALQERFDAAVATTVALTAGTAAGERS